MDKIETLEVSKDNLTRARMTEHEIPAHPECKPRIAAC